MSGTNFSAHPHLIRFLGTDGLLICDVLECGLAPNPTTAQVAFVIDENIHMYLEPKSQIVNLSIEEVSHGPATEATER